MRSRPPDEDPEHGCGEAGEKTGAGNQENRPGPLQAAEEEERQRTYDSSNSNDPSLA